MFPPKKYMHSSPPPTKHLYPTSSPTARTLRWCNSLIFVRLGVQVKDWLSQDEGDGEDSEEGKRNNILQKAILLYIGSVSLLWMAVLGRIF